MKVEITVEETPSTGYTWELTGDYKEFTVYDECQRIDPELVGGSHKVRYVIDLKHGETCLLVHRYPFADEPPIQSIQIHG